MISRLKEFGLLTNEASIYVALLTHPNITASMLCKETGIPDSKIYYALDALSKKGMLIVQRGNPNIYQPISPKEAIANLKQQLTETLNEKLKEADALTDMLTPIYENVDKSGDFELAYIIRGQKNIISRMRALIETARKEITVFIAFPEVLRELRKSFMEAREKRRVKLNIAITKEVFEKQDCSGLGEIRLLSCPVEQINSLGMLISDMKTLVTVSDWGEETAMLTQDPNLIRITRDYFDSPTCCKKAQ